MGESLEIAQAGASSANMERKIREEFAMGFSLLKDEIAGLYCEINMLRHEIAELKEKNINSNVVQATEAWATSKTTNIVNQKVPLELSS